MLYALNTETREKISAIKGIPAICPGCELPVIAKIGSVVIPHWAHQKNSNCSFSEGETPWHLEWKSKFPKENCEIRMGNHRADVFINNVVLEFQSVTPDYKKILEREAFYENMFWIYNYCDKPIGIRKYFRYDKYSPKEYLDSYDIVNLSDENFQNEYEYNYCNLFEQRITIYHPPKGWLNASKKIFLDLGHPKIYKKSFGEDIYCGRHEEGFLFFIRWHSDNFKELFGRFYSYTDFLEKFE